MSRLKRLQTRNVVLAGTAAVLLAIVLLAPSSSSGVDEESLALLFQGFEPDQARVVQLRQGASATGEAGELVLTMKPDGEWVVSSQSGYPIVAGRQDRLLEGIGRMRVRKLVTTRAETFDEYAGPTGWLEIAVFGAGGKPMAAFALGKTARYPEMFVRLGNDDDARVVQTVNLTRDMASTDVSRWVEPRLFPDLLAENVIRVDIEQPAFARNLVLAKKGEPKQDVGFTVPAKDEGAEGRDWAIVQPKIMEAEQVRVEDLIRSFTGLRFAQVAAASVTDETRAKYGLDTPDAIVSIRHRDLSNQITNRKLVIGGKTEDGTAQYVRVGDLPWVYEAAPYQLADFRRPTEEFEYTPPEEPAKDGDDGGETEAAGSPDGTAAGSPDGDGDPAPAPPPALETYEVVLTKAGDTPIELLKAVRAATGLGLADAKALVDGAPATIKAGLSQTDADTLAAALRAAGAEVEVKPGG